MLKNVPETNQYLGMEINVLALQRKQAVWWWRGSNGQKINQLQNLCAIYIHWSLPSSPLKINDWSIDYFINFKIVHYINRSKKTWVYWYFFFKRFKLNQSCSKLYTILTGAKKAGLLIFILLKTLQTESKLFKIVHYINRSKNGVFFSYLMMNDRMCFNNILETDDLL